MSETREFKDAITCARGYMPGVPLHVQDNVGDAAIAGRNVLFSRYNEVRSWRGFSPLNSNGARLLHNVGGRLGGSATGNVWKQHGEAYFFIGSGDVYVEDFTQKIGTATSQLQLYVNDKAYQAGLPKPSPPDLTIAVDALGQPVTGQISGQVSAQLSRIRTVTGAESEASDTSNIVNLTNGRLRLAFPANLTDQGQDEWGVYLSRQGFGGLGPHQLYRQIPEGEIAPFAFARLAACPGDGVTTVFGGTSAVAANSRIAAIVLRPAAATLPSYVGSSFAVTPGGTQSIRVQRPVGAADGQYLTVMVTFKATHTVIPDGTNRGTVTVAAVTGVWMGPGVPLDPQGEKIDIIIDSTTTFKWKLRSAGAYSAALPLSTSPTAMGANGLAVAWTATSTSALEVGNHYEVDIFALYAPAGWFPTPVEWQNNPNSLVGIGIYGQILDSSSGEFFEWTSNRAAQMNALAVAWRDVDTTIAPTVQSNSDYKIAATTHNAPALPLGAPTATQLVTFWYTSDGSAADFTPTAPLAVVTDTDLLPRFLDLDYADDDLLDTVAPRGIEPPPAGTHAFPYGVVTVIAGILDGTALVASNPNQSEQYDIERNVQFLNPPEPIVRCEASPYDGSVYLWTRNSLQTVVYAGDQIVPRTIWNNTGISGQSAACISKSGAYCFSGKRGIARYRGNLEPDTSFADSVAEYVESWDPDNVAVGYSPFHEAVVYCYDKEILVYFETQGNWSAPCRIDLWNSATIGEGALSSDSRIVSCLTLENQLYFVVQSGEDYQQVFQIYSFDVGVGGDWFIRSVARHAGANAFNKTLRAARLVADLSSEQPIEWYWQNGLHQQGQSLIQDNPTVDGYAVSKIYLPPTLLVRGKIRFEWTVTTNGSAETWAAFAQQTSLRRYGVSPGLPLVKYNVGAKLAWRISPSNVLTWYTGATGTVKGVVQDGDVIRIDFEGSGVVKGSLFRAGAQVGLAHDFGYDNLSWTDWHGWKVQVEDSGNVDVGRVCKYAQTGGFRFYKNFGAERGLVNIYEKTYNEDGPKHYPWARPNKTNIVTYNAEMFGSAGNQKPSVLYLGGWVPGEFHEGLTT